MSTAPSKPLENVLWSIQMLVADSCTLMASSSQSRNVMLRMMTLRSPLMLNPQPTIVAPELPRIVLFERTRSMPEHEIVPEIRITDALDEPTAVVSALALVTVVVAALPPPVVPPFWVAQPTRPVCGGPGGPVLVGGGWLLELDVVGGGVVAESVTSTSSKFAVAWNVCRAMRPAPIALLVPDAICVPSTKPRMVVPETSTRSVYH